MRNILLPVTVIGMICSLVLPESRPDLRKRETPYRYCGPNLANVLRFLCNGSYHMDEYWKRGAGSFRKMQTQDMELGFWTQPETSAQQFPFRPWWMANQLANREFRRRKRQSGIVEECCLFKGCTISELSEYCSGR